MRKEIREETLASIVNYLKENDGSDIHFAPNNPVGLRIKGKIERIDDYPLSPEDTTKIYELLLFRVDKEQHNYINNKLKEFGNTGFSLEIEGVRFRVNASKNVGGIYIVMRKISEDPPPLEKLGFEKDNMEGLKYIASRHAGLFLVVGATGSGKSTTLASIIRYINENYQKNIITLEDPIEYVHKPIKSQIVQKELGRDFPAFKNGLHSALREDPDIILVGEIRDEETLDLCLKASETGHLVFGTLHTHNVVSTIQRLSAMSHNPALTRDRLASVYLGGTAQKLALRKDGNGRVLIYEMLVADKSVLSQIRENKDTQILSLLDTLRYSNSYNKNIRNRYRDGLIDKDTAFEASPEPHKLNLDDIEGNGSNSVHPTVNQTGNLPDNNGNGSGGKRSIIGIRKGGITIE